jgi:hypothetical protein
MIDGITISLLALPLALAGTPLESGDLDGMLMLMLINQCTRIEYDASKETHREEYFTHQGQAPNDER